MSRRILVCGASGQCGGSAIDTLRSKRAVFRAGTRRPEEARRTRPGFDWVRVDYEDVSTLDAALEGVDALFLVTPYVPEARKIEVARTLIGRAKRAGVARIVTVSSMNSDLHADSTTSVVERLVEDSGATFTHLRPNWYMQNYHTHYLASIRNGAIDHYIGEAVVYIERGECARISPIVSQILGRAPIRFEEYARSHAGLWRRS